MTTTTYTVPVTGLDPVEVTVNGYGSGQPFTLSASTYPATRSRTFSR